MTAISRTSRFGQNLSPYENGYVHAPAVEKAGGLLGSRVSPALPDHKTCRIN
jgi:hypothetical protein